MGWKFWRTAIAKLDDGDVLPCSAMPTCGMYQRGVVGEVLFLSYLRPVTPVTVVQIPLLLFLEFRVIVS